MRGRGPSPFHGAPKSSRRSGLRHFSDLAVSPSWSVALRLRPALGSLRSSEN